MSQSTLTEFLAEASRESNAGNLWRAKEILHKQIKYAGYNLLLFEKLGNVLLRMNDLVEAGKYLFLSGVKKPEYQKAVDLFLQKYEDKPHNLFHPFPRSAKLSKISDCPEAVAVKLRELGFTDGLETVHGIYSKSLNTNTNTNRIIAIVILSIISAILILLILGIVKLFEIVF